MRYLYFLLLPFLLLSAGCTQDLDLPDIGGKKQIVLLGELVAADSLKLRGGCSIPVSSGSNLESSLPADLRMTVNGPDGSSTIVPFFDDYTLQAHTLSFLGGRVRAGSSYSLSATDPELGEATVQVTVPEVFEGSITAFNRGTYAGDSVMRFVVRIKDRPGEHNFYSIEAVKQNMQVSGSFFYRGVYQPIDLYRWAYDSIKASGGKPLALFDTVYAGQCSRQYLYTPDVAAENVKAGSSLQRLRRALLTDKVFDGGDYEVEIFVLTQDFVTNNRNEKGRIFLQVKSISEDYFNYLRSYDNFDASAGTGFNNQTQPVRLKGNVAGGLGIVGGVYRVQQVFLFDDWGY